MRTYGLRGKAKHFHCGWGCCWYSIRGVPMQMIVRGRKASVRNRLKRYIKRCAREDGKREIAEQMRDLT